MAEELLFVTGPLLVGLLVNVASPAIGLAVSAALVLTGSFALAASPPARGWRIHQPAAAGRTTPSAPAPGPAPPRGGPGLRQAIVVTAGVGMCLAALELLAVVVADERHTPAAVAWIMAALSAGSAAGGLIYGAVPWRVSAGLRLSACAAGLGLVVAAAGLSPHPHALVAWAALGGFFVAPALTTAYLIADECADPDSRTRAGAWVNTAFNAGSARATAATGLVVGRLPLPVCFALAATPALLSAATALNRSRSVAALAPHKDEVPAGAAVPEGSPSAP